MQHEESSNLGSEDIGRPDRPINMHSWRDCWTTYRNGEDDPVPNQHCYTATTITRGKCITIILTAQNVSKKYG